jgi:uncharacterized protein YcbK (DUF882 family)
VKKWIEFKESHREMDVLYFERNLVKVLLEMSEYFEEHGKPFLITSGIRNEAENRGVGAKSKTHCDGRAADVRVHGIDVFWIDDMVSHFLKKFGHYGAISSKTGKPRLIVWKTDENHMDHLHIQVSRKQ